MLMEAFERKKVYRNPLPGVEGGGERDFTHVQEVITQTYI